MYYRDRPSPVCSFAWMIDSVTLGESQRCTRYLQRFLSPAKKPRCHTLAFNNGILTSKWENVLGKHRGYWLSQSKWDHAKKAFHVSLCLVTADGYKLHKRFAIKDSMAPADPGDAAAHGFYPGNWWSHDLDVKWFEIIIFFSPSMKSQCYRTANRRQVAVNSVCPNVLSNLFSFSRLCL